MCDNTQRICIKFNVYSYGSATTYCKTQAIGEKLGCIAYRCSHQSDHHHRHHHHLHQNIIISGRSEEAADPPSLPKHSQHSSPFSHRKSAPVFPSSVLANRCPFSAMLLFYQRVFSSHVISSKRRPPVIQPGLGSAVSIGGCGNAPIANGFADSQR